MNAGRSGDRRTSADLTGTIRRTAHSAKCGRSYASRRTIPGVLRWVRIVFRSAQPKPNGTDNCPGGSGRGLGGGMGPSPARARRSMAKTKCLKEFTGPEQSFYALSERGRGGFGLSDFESRRVLTDGAERRATPAPRSSRTWTTAWSGFEPSTRLYANSGDAIRREPEPTQQDEVFTTHR